MTFEDWVSETYPNLVGVTHTLMRAAWDRAMTAERERVLGLVRSQSAVYDFTSSARDVLTTLEEQIGAQEAHAPTDRGPPAPGADGAAEA